MRDWIMAMVFGVGFAAMLTGLGTWIWFFDKLIKGPGL